MKKRTIKEEAEFRAIRGSHQGDRTWRRMQVLAGMEENPLTTPLVVEYRVRLSMAAHSMRMRFGDTPMYQGQELRYGEDSETSALISDWKRRRGEHLRSIRAPIIADFRHYLRQQTHDGKRRGLTNREGAHNRRWRRYLAANNHEWSEPA